MAKNTQKQLSLGETVTSDDEIGEILRPIPATPSQILEYNDDTIDPTRISGAVTMSQIVDGKLIETRSYGVQTLYAPEYGILFNHSTTDSMEPEKNDDRPVQGLEEPEPDDKYITHGYFDYKSACPEQFNLKLLLKEIRYDMDYLLKISELQRQESLIPSLLIDEPPISGASSLESNLLEVVGFSQERGVSSHPPSEKHEVHFDREPSCDSSEQVIDDCTLEQSPYYVECQDEECGVIDDPNQEIPMDEFTLARRKIAALPVNKQLKAAIGYLCDKGDPLAILPDIDKVPWLIRWFEIRRGILVDLTEADKQELLDESTRLWDTVTFNVCNIPIPKMDKKMVTWAEMPALKHKANAMMAKYQRQVRQQLVNNARNYFPPMKIEYFRSPLNQSFRRTYFDYMPSREADTLTIKPWRHAEHRGPDEGECGQVASCRMRQTKFETWQ